MIQKSSLGSFLVPICFVLSLFPIVNSAIALLMGVAIAILVGNPYLARTRKLTKPMLAWAIIGLGAGVDLSVVLRVGSEGALFTAIALLFAILAGIGIGRLMQIPKEMASLISVGTAICGGSAIAAVSSVIRAKDESISMSLAVVFILNAVALLTFPSIGSWLNMTQEQFGLWAALAIHDTSSVVGAALQYGPQALDIATTVKLVRALWIVPVALIFAQIYDRQSDSSSKSKIQFPWFIAGFIAMSALVTTVTALQPIGHQLEFFAKRLLVGTLFLIGCGMTKSSIRDLGFRTLGYGVLLWLVVASTSLGFILSR